jgi:hypothetical protein
MNYNFAPDKSRINDIPYGMKNVKMNMIREEEKRKCADIFRRRLCAPAENDKRKEYRIS